MHHRVPHNPLSTTPYITQSHNHTSLIPDHALDYARTRPNTQRTDRPPADTWTSMRKQYIVDARNTPVDFHASRRFDVARSSSSSRRHTAPARTRRPDRARVRRRRARERHGYVMGDAAAIDTGAWTQGWVWERRIWCCDGVRARRRRRLTETRVFVDRACVW